MHLVNSNALKTLRNRKGLSQEALASKAKTSKRNIARYERGEDANVRDHIFAGLIRALGVTADELAGRQPIEVEETQSMLFPGTSQIAITLDHRVRNALALTAKRYGVRASLIVELAPLLFAIVAEQSLLKRRDVLATAFNALAVANEALGSHLHRRFDWHADDVIVAEQTSIRKRDLFAAHVADDQIDPDFEFDTHAPFVNYLKRLVDETKAASDFNWFAEGLAPQYKVALEVALELASGDQDLADAILCGGVALHRMPRELRGETALDQRTEWLRSETAIWKRRQAESWGILGEI